MAAHVAHTDSDRTTQTRNDRRRFNGHRAQKKNGGYDHAIQNLQNRQSPNYEAGSKASANNDNFIILCLVPTLQIRCLMDEETLRDTEIHFTSVLLLLFLLCFGTPTSALLMISLAHTYTIHSMHITIHGTSAHFE
jgi:hypothetical protein